MFLMDSRADGVEADTLAGMDHSKFSGQRENGTLHADARVSLKGVDQRWTSREPTFEAVSA